MQQKNRNKQFFFGLIFYLALSAQANSQALQVQSMAIPYVNSRPIKVARIDEGVSIPPRPGEHASKNEEISTFIYFDRVPASTELIKLTNWISETGDNQNAPYLIIDKAHAQLLIFNSDGKLAGSTPVLLGMAFGDELALDTHQLALAKIQPADRVTPAGRFTLEFGHDLQGQDILWIDYEGSISLHRTFEGNAKERRKERMQTPTAADNRISYGCVNVSKEFYEKIIRNVFRDGTGFVYIMPEEHALILPFK